MNLINILIAFLALNILIVVHELGHFTVAKLSKIIVHEFSIFMGPKIFSFKIGETRYSLRSIPMGGYVKLEGEDVSSEHENAYNNKPLFVRAAVIFAGPFMNIILALAIFFIIFLNFGYDSNVVGYIEEYSPAYKAGIVDGDKIKSYNGKDVYTQTDLVTFIYLDKAEKSTIEVERDGKIISVELTPRVYKSERYLLGLSFKNRYGPESNILGFNADYDFSKSDFQNNDKVVALNDKKVSELDEILNFMYENKEKEVEVTIDRNGKLMTFKVKPELSRMEMDSYEIGLGLKMMQSGVIETAKASFVHTYAIVRNVGYTFYGLLTKKIPINGVMGPVGIVATISDVVEVSLQDSINTFFNNLLRITAILSVAVGITNLFPIPPLDGSKLVLIALEGIRRKPLSQKYEQAIAMFGFILLIVIFVLVLYNDIFRLVQNS